MYFKDKNKQRFLFWVVYCSTLHQKRVLKFSIFPVFTVFFSVFYPSMILYHSDFFIPFSKIFWSWITYVFFILYLLFTSKNFLSLNGGVYFIKKWFNRLFTIGRLPFYFYIFRKRTPFSWKSNTKPIIIVFNILNLINTYILLL